MGYKLGGDAKEEEKNELNNGIDDEEKTKETPHNLDYYLQKFENEEKEKINIMVDESQNYSQKMLDIFILSKT